MNNETLKYNAEKVYNVLGVPKEYMEAPDENPRGKRVVAFINLRYRLTKNIKR